MFVVGALARFRGRLGTIVDVLDDGVVLVFDETMVQVPVRGGLLEEIEVWQAPLGGVGIPTVMSDLFFSLDFSECKLEDRNGFAGWDFSGLVAKAFVFCGQLSDLGVLTSFENGGECLAHFMVADFLARV